MRVKVYIASLYYLRDGCYLNNPSTKVFSTLQKAQEYKGNNDFIFIYEFEVDWWKYTLYTKLTEIAIS